MNSDISQTVSGRENQVAGHDITNSPCKQVITEGNGNLQIHGDGNHVTLTPDRIYHVVDAIRSEEDIEPSIALIRNHIEDLQHHKGLRDARIFLLLIMTICFSAAIFRWDIYSIPLVVLGAAGIYWGQKQQRFVDRVNAELAASNSVLLELYKQKLLQRVNGKGR